MNLIALVSIVATKEHLDKTVLNPGSGTWIKGQDKLLAQLKLSIKLMGDMELYATTDIIRNQDNSNKEIFDFTLDSKQAELFI